MRELVVDSWNGIMNAEVNPLRHIPDLNTRHMVLQVLAWMWCIVFSMYMGSLVVMGVSMIAHALFLAAIFATALPIPEPAPVIRIFLLESKSSEILREGTCFIIYFLFQLANQ